MQVHLPPMNWRASIEEAQTRIASVIHRTPVQKIPVLAPSTDTEVWLKLENAQVTGSFKARGGSNKILSLSMAQRAHGVITASSGNHGAGTAHAAAQVQVPLTVYVPEHADPEKTARIAGLGARVERFGTDCVETEAHARSIAQATEHTYISPYNDPAVVAGQGTIAVELIEQLPHLDAVFVAMGGGGLISGIGMYLKSVSPKTEVVGCSPSASPAMHRCLQAGAVIDVPCEETLSDATAGGVEPDAITLPLCQQVVDRTLLVDETAIARAMYSVHSATGLRIEGAAGVAVAGWLQVADDYRGKCVAVIICGGNIAEATWQEAMSLSGNAD